jgi:hypothetical protein
MDTVPGLFSSFCSLSLSRISGLSLESGLSGRLCLESLSGISPLDDSFLDDSDRNL